MNTVRFAALPAPPRTVLWAIAQKVRDQVADLLAPQEELDSTTQMGSEEPLLTACAAASVQGQVATGSRAGSRVVRRGRSPPRPRTHHKPASAEVDGFNLHAGVRLAQHERARLERLARYVLRPPISQERLKALDDGRIAYHFKRPWQDGTRQVVLTGHELIEKLVALVPPPRAHQVVYHGVLAPHARLRAQVIPAGPVAPATSAPTVEAPKRLRMDWATLLARVHAIDLRVCPRCGGPMKVIAAITQTEVIRAILKSCGLSSAPPPPVQVSWLARHALAGPTI